MGDATGYRRVSAASARGALVTVPYRDSTKDYLRLSIIIPVFNEEAMIEPLYARLAPLVASADWRRFTRIELVLVDDGSTDRTPFLLREMAKKAWDPRVDVRVLHFSRNFGHSAAVLAGLDAARGDLIAIVDADFQDPPELIPAMCAKIDEGWDVVYGQRAQRKGETLSKRATAWLFYRIISLLSGNRIPKDTGDFRVLTREVCNAIKLCNETEPFLRGLISWLGFRQTPFLYVRDARLHGETKYPFRKMLRFASLGLVAFSSLPLRLALYLGLLGLALFGSITGWAVLMNVRGYAIPGWTPLVIGVTWGQSILLIMIGIVGVYLGRVHAEVQGRPRYIVRHRAPDERGPAVPTEAWAKAREARDDGAKAWGRPAEAWPEATTALGD